MADHILICKNITVSFGGLVAINKFDFQVDKGETVGLIGPNGAGKSTFFNVATGYIAPIGGSIEFCGKEIQSGQPHIIANMGISRTFQNGSLFTKMTVLENVLVGLNKSTKTNFFGGMFESKKAKLEEEKAYEKALNVISELGIMHLVDRIGTDLSVGEQRLVEIARVLATEPQLLLLDEPAAGLSPIARERLVELLKTIREKRDITMIVTDHIVDLIMKISDRITVLNYGEKIAEGSSEEIKNNRTVMDAYLGE